MKSQLTSLFQQHFNSAPQSIASAPGRIEFIGNHTDYNGGQVLGAAVDRFVMVALSRTEEDTLRFVSEGHPAVQLKATEIKPQTGESAWVNYPLGVLESLRKDGLHFSGGLQLAVQSNLPHGAGMSSSAAFELATALTLTHLFGLELDKKALAKVCRRAENEFVGVPCGILDQGVSAFGKTDHLVHIDCRYEVFATVPLQPDTHFWIFNSEKKHSLVESLYETRHRECMSALKKLQAFYPEAGDLCSLSPDQVKAHHDKLTEDEFARALHVTAENARVKHAVKALQSGEMATCGELLFGSHFSSKTLFQNSIPELDFLVDLLRENNEVYGARLTGGGFGGAVMAMTTKTFGEKDAAEITSAYLEKFGFKPSIFHTRTGDGASLT